MFNPTKIEKRVNIKNFLDFIQEYNKKNIECAEQTFFRISEKQRKIFTVKELIKIITQKKPFLVGVQYNKNYAVFYEYKNRNLKIIVNLRNKKIKIVTFYFIEK